MPKIASLWLASAVLLQPEETLTYEAVARAARPSPAELAAKAELADLRQALATSSRGLLEEPVLEVSAGPRFDHDDDETEGDVELELEVPWRKRSNSRQRLEELAGEAAAILPAAASAAAALELRHAYVEAWRAQELLELRRSARDAAQRLAEVAGAREQAGADPPFEAQLARLEAEEAASAVAATGADLDAAWQRLAGLAQPSLERFPLEQSTFHSGLAVTAAGATSRPRPLPADRPTDSGRCLAGCGDTGRDRRGTKRARARLGVSRLSWLGSVAREGREDVARFGVALALQRPGVATSRREAADSAVESARRQSELARSELAARFASAHARLRAAQSSAGTTATESFDVPLAAIEARLTAGRASPAETLTLRRQVLALREQALERAALREHAAAELIALCTPVEEVTP